MRGSGRRPGVVLVALVAVLAWGAVRAWGVQQSSEEATTDGGGTPDVLESIFVPALPGAPFTMTLATEWTRLMNNGGTFTSVNQREIRRDSAGRISMERWTLVPKGSEVRSQLTAIQIADPVAGTLLQCMAARHICVEFRWEPPPTQRYQPGRPGQRTLTNGRGFFDHEDLGESDVLGQPVHLYRDTTTLNAGTFGNSKPLVTTREFSYSPKLGVNLHSVLDTPQVGRQQFDATVLTTSEPEARLFLPPEGYRIDDRRSGQPLH